ncbi:MAG: arsenite methyltransferase [Candidatus Eisenbacteria bacterium]|nr:arsenite methyltransferase [Candidatus Eisenbacteria bacterium]
MTSSPTNTAATDPRATVREKYGAIAEGRDPGCCAGSCCSDTPDVLDRIGYTPEQAAAIPAGANLGLGCGNPLAWADLRAGETVLDLGSGAGIDCFLAAREVGSTGRVIGVDMTPAMIERARANAATSAGAAGAAAGAAGAAAGAAAVEFRLGEIEHLPVADASVDVVISNCVINLSPDKPQAFREALRALRPAGRMLVSDLVLTHALDDRTRADLEQHVGCVAGAAVREDYLGMMRDAGFADVEIVEESGYDVGADRLAADSPGRIAFAAVRSVKVRARKP